jgi:hypothetical protein
MAGRNRITVKWTGVSETQAKIRGLGPALLAGTMDGLNAIGLMVQNRARELIQRGSKTGRIYQKYGPRRTHQASAPGEAPATDTGGLVRSVQADMNETEREVEISAGGPAKHLEYGTRHMAPRPFLLPALEWIRDKAGAVLAAAIRARLPK